MSEGFATSKELAMACMGKNDEQFVGFGATDVDAMRDAIESGRVSWDVEDGATWQEITQDAKNACILTFYRTPYGVLITDEN